MTLRIATWNMQALFPVRSDGKWGYLEATVDADLAVLTEAKPDPSSDYQQVYKEGGLGKRRRWGTIVAARPDLSLVEVPGVRHRFRTYDLYRTIPGSVVVADIFRGNRRLLTLVGVYATGVSRSGAKTGNGEYTTRAIFNDLTPLFAARRHRGIVVAGDLNLWPNRAHRRMRGVRLVDLVEETASRRPATPACVCGSKKPCRHIWTHNNSFAGKFQQLDYIFATDDLADRLIDLKGGPEAFPDIWQWSDHAPIVATLDLD